MASSVLRAAQATAPSTAMCRGAGQRLRVAVDAYHRPNRRWMVPRQCRARVGHVSHARRMGRVASARPSPASRSASALVGRGDARRPLGTRGPHLKTLWTCWDPRVRTCASRRLRHLVWWLVAQRWTSLALLGAPGWRATAAIFHPARHHAPFSTDMRAHDRRVVRGEHPRCAPWWFLGGASALFGRRWHGLVSGLRAASSSRRDARWSTRRAAYGTQRNFRAASLQQHRR